MKRHYASISILIMTLLSLPAVGFAQSIITGTVLDSVRKPVAKVTVTYSKINSTLISGYTQTDEAGSFKLTIPASMDSILLSVKHIAYGEKILRLKNAAGHHSIVLDGRSQLLSAVKIFSSPIYRRNDTINYNVQTFTSKQDRVIADVIKKLPGVEMEGDKILYNGKPIQQYLINGLDLLGNRYAIANSNLPIEAVKKVQVIENHQPIKMLDSVVLSDRASLNVQLKKLTTTGSGKIGTGLEPALWDLNLTPMTFNKKFQAISSIQSNNVGDDVSRQQASIGSGISFGVVDESDAGWNQPASLMYIQDISTPPLNEKKWLDNHVNVLSTNMLQKLKGDYELKGSVSFIKDYKKRTGTTRTTLLLPEQDIDFSEAIYNSYNENELKGDIIISKNEKNVYSKNNLKIGRRWNNDSGSLTTNTALPFDQSKTLDNFSLSNRFTAVKLIKKHLFTFNSLVILGNSPQRLAVSPGLFEEVFNEGLSYQKLEQHVRFRNFRTDNHVSFIKPLKGITLIPKLGFSLQDQTLENELSLHNEGQTKQMTDEFSNSLGFKTNQVYADMKIQHKSARWRFDLGTPLRLRHYDVQDRIRETDNSLSALTFEPNGYAIYSYKRNLELGISSFYSRDFGGIDRLYSAYLLTSYRNLQRFNSTIPQGNNWSTNFFVNYKNPDKALFSNLYVNRGLQRQQYLFRNIIDEKGFNTMELIDRDNTMNFESLSGDVSKYWLSIKTVVKLGGSLSRGSSEFLLNDNLDKLQSRGYGANIKINNNTLKKLSITYDGSWNLSRNKSSGNRSTTASFNSHVLGLNFFPGDNHILNLTTDFYRTNLTTQEAQVFTDFQYVFKIPKKKIDLEFSGLNLLNNRTYTRISNSQFSLIRSDFELRPRQFLTSVRFKF